jgi:hypothetical protein
MQNVKGSPIGGPFYILHFTFLIKILYAVCRP